MMQAAADGSAGNRSTDDHCFFHWLCQGPSPMLVRYIYVVLFFVANIMAWLERENPKMFFEWQRRSGCMGDRDCHAAEAVLIISLTCFLFFLAMFFGTVYTRKIQDCGNMWHSQWWPAKIVPLASALVISIMAPSHWLQIYGKVAHFGAGIFLFIQLMSVIRYMTRLNYIWCLTNFENRYHVVIAVSIVANSSFTVGIILMCFWYGGCWMNFAFIGTTLLLVYLLYLISLRSKDKGFYMEPGLVGVYIVFLCWSAIRSEPETSCYKKAEEAGSGPGWKTLVSFVAELISITVAALSTGSDYKCVQFRNVVESEHDVPYGYGFFHFVFAMGSMYFGMLFVGWDTHHTMKRWNIDVGWTSTWVHIVNEGLTIIAFVAILLARIYGIGWLRHLLALIFGIGGQQQGGIFQNTELVVSESLDTRLPPLPSSQTTELQIPEPPMNTGTSRRNDTSSGLPPLPSSRTPEIESSETPISAGTSSRNVSELPHMPLSQTTVPEIYEVPDQR